MSIANKKLKPIPTSPSSGKYAKVEKQYGGLLRIIRNFEMDGGAENFPANIEEYVFDDYGTPDGQTTAPCSVAPDPKYIFPNTYLEEQEIDKASGNQGSVFVSKLYQEAYDTIREIEKPVKNTDENGRKSTRRTYVILNTAPEANKEIGATAIPDPDDPNQIATTQQLVEGNAVSIITRDFIEATDELEQVGGDKAEKDQNDKWTVTRDFIGTLAAPLGDEDVGVDTITYDGLTLYLAALQVSETAFTKRVRKVWREKQILSVSTPKVGGDQQVRVQALGLSEAEVTSAIAEVTANHKLVNVAKGNYQGYQTIDYTFEVDSFDVRDRTENGLLTLTRTELDTSNFTDGDVGVDTLVNGSLTLYLAGEEIDNGNTIKKRVRRWAEPGILTTQREFGRDGLLYVTFQSQGTRFTPTALNTPTRTLADEDILAFQGGPDADLFRSRTSNVDGFKRFIVTVMMLQNGDPLDDENDNEVHSFQRWVPYRKPGLLDVQSDDGPRGYPGPDRFLRVNIQEFLSKDGNLSDDFRPYTVKEWASYRISFTPSATGIAQVVSEGANGYLADSNKAANNITYWGQEVDSVAAIAGSTPSPSVFYALEDQVINSDNDPAFTTDEGEKWYRKVKITVDGTFGDYLNL